MRDENHGWTGFLRRAPARSSTGSTGAEFELRAHGRASRRWAEAAHIRCGGNDIMTLLNGTTIGLRSISTVETISANGHSGVTILGSTGNDVLHFTVVTLVNTVSIDGGGGNDSITGSAGADVITIAGPGTIRLSGVTGANIDITDFILAP